MAHRSRAPPATTRRVGARKSLKLRARQLFHCAQRAPVHATNPATNPRRAADSHTHFPSTRHSETATNRFASFSNCSTTLSARSQRAVHRGQPDAAWSSQTAALANPAHWPNSRQWPLRFCTTRPFVQQCPRGECRVDPPCAAPRRRDLPQWRLCPIRAMEAGLIQR
jgi:hypothetical protein